MRSCIEINLKVHCEIFENLKNEDEGTRKFQGKLFKFFLVFPCQVGFNVYMRDFCDLEPQKLEIICGLLLLLQINEIKIQKKS